MCVEWFTGKHLAVAMGVSLSVSRLVSHERYLDSDIQGSVLAFSTESAIRTYFKSYEVALWIGRYLCSF